MIFKKIFFSGYIWEVCLLKLGIRKLYILLLLLKKGFLEVIVNLIRYDIEIKVCKCFFFESVFFFVRFIKFIIK